MPVSRRQVLGGLIATPIVAAFPIPIITPPQGIVITSSSVGAIYSGDPMTKGGKMVYDHSKDTIRILMDREVVFDYENLEV